MTLVVWCGFFFGALRTYAVYFLAIFSPANIFRKIYWTRPDRRAEDRVSSQEGLIFSEKTPSKGLDAMKTTQLLLGSLLLGSFAVGCATPPAPLLTNQQFEALRAAEIQAENAAGQSRHQLNNQQVSIAVRCGMINGPGSRSHVEVSFGVASSIPKPVVCTCIVALCVLGGIICLAYHGIPFCQSLGYRVLDSAQEWARDSKRIESLKLSWQHWEGEFLQHNYAAKPVDSNWLRLVWSLRVCMVALIAFRCVIAGR